MAEGRYVFRPLWGPGSCDWGAGRRRLDDAAAFIRANMPPGGTLSEPEAWDVALFMHALERTRTRDSLSAVAQTRRRFHGDPNWLAARWSMGICSAAGRRGAEA